MAKVGGSVAEPSTCGIVSFISVANRCEHRSATDQHRAFETYALVANREGVLRLCN